MLSELQWAGHRNCDANHTRSTYTSARANTHVIYRKLPPLPEPNLSERPLASLIILSRDLSSNSRPERAMSLL